MKVRRLIERIKEKEGSGRLYLLYKVKTQYVQNINVIDTSIKCPNSGQSTPMVKGCMNIHLIW